MTEVLTVNLNRCENCGVCEMACAERHSGKARLKVKDTLRSRGLMFDDVALPIVCKQCESPQCVSVCKTKALVREDGVVYLDEAKCIGCGKCAKSCPFNAIFIDEGPTTPTVAGREPSALSMIFARKVGAGAKTKRRAKIVRKARKCDRCKGYDNMACVDVCYFKALSLRDVDTLAHKGKKEHEALVQRQLATREPVSEA